MPRRPSPERPQDPTQRLESLETIGAIETHAESSETPEEKEEREYIASLRTPHESAQRYSREASLARQSSESRKTNTLLSQRFDKRKESVPRFGDWKRETSSGRGGFLGTLANGIRSIKKLAEGSKHPVDIQVFTNYLETTAREPGQTSVDISGYEAFMQEKKWREERVKIFKREKITVDGKPVTRFTIANETPFQATSQDTKHLDKLLGKRSDPIEVLGELQNFGIKICSSFFTPENIKVVAEFVDQPGIAELVRKLGQYGFSSTSYGRTETPAELLAVIEKINTLSKDRESIELLEQHGEQFRKVLLENSIVLFPDAESIHTLIACISNPVALEFVENDFGYYSRTPEGNKDMLKLILSMEGRGVLARFLKLTKIASPHALGQPVREMYIDAGSRQKHDEVISGVEAYLSKPPISELLDSEETYKNVKTLCEWSGNTIESNSYTSDIFAYLNEHSKEVLAYFGQMKDLGIEPFSDDKFLSQHIMGTCMIILGIRHKQFKGSFFNPQLKKLKDKFGVTFESKDFVNYNRYTGANDFNEDIDELYELRDEAEIIFSERGEKLIKLLGKCSLSRMHDYIEALKHDGITELVDQLSTRNIVFRSQGDFFELMPQLLSLPEDKRVVYLDVLQKITATPSQEIKRLEKEIILEVMDSEDPVAAFDSIENIFVKNNLPLVGKVYKVFETLFTAKRFAEDLEKQPKTSPVLGAAGPRRRFSIVYQDLIKIHVDSGNRSLRNYIKIIQEGSQIMREVEQRGIENLTDDEREQLSFFLNKLDTLAENSSLSAVPGQTNSVEVTDISSLEGRIAEARMSLRMKEGQTFEERVHEMFLSPLGVSKIGDVLSLMDGAKVIAHERGLENAKPDAFALSNGGFAKGVDARYIANILQNGSVAKEFLGGSSTQDSTPFDTDVSYIKGGSVSATTAEIQSSLSNGYGEVMIVIKDRGQFSLTRNKEGENLKYDPTKPEVFHSGVVGEDHCGIRTGFASTEIDYLIVKEEILKDKPQQLEDICIEIAQNGYYVPIYSIDGDLLFTENAYNNYRKAYQGIDYFDGEPLDVRETNQTQVQYGDVKKIKDAKVVEAPELEKTKTSIASSVKKVLDEKGISFRSRFDTGSLGAELVDIGSTGRNTNIPGNPDFDFVLKLDRIDFLKANDIAITLKESFAFEADNSHQESGGYYQLRLSQVNRIGELVLSESIDIDIGIASNTDIDLYDTNDALDAKFKWIKDNLGEDSYDDVVANIVLAKKVLKEAKAYKKADEGGIGGVGVENWILAHGGNVQQAFESFRDAAYDGGVVRPLKDFKTNYKIIDPGINIKKNRHDDFIRLLTEDGFARMLKAVEDYLSK